MRVSSIYSECTWVNFYIRDIFVGDYPYHRPFHLWLATLKPIKLLYPQTFLIHHPLVNCGRVHILINVFLYRTRMDCCIYYNWGRENLKYFIILRQRTKQYIIFIFWGSNFVRKNGRLLGFFYNPAHLSVRSFLENDLKYKVEIIIIWLSIAPSCLNNQISKLTLNNFKSRILIR